MSDARATDPWAELLGRGKEDGRVVAATQAPARAGSFVDAPAQLHPRLLEALGERRLYAHQERALQAAWEGPTIVTTGTASGKSLCFNLPTLDVLLRDRRARALYLYPTKALAADQARALLALGLGDALRPSIYDGDTPREARGQIRARANVVLTNPDMLHVGILPHHRAWSALFSNLAVVVLDEAHVYRGVFGSHVANVLRRLRRIAAAYGTAPRLLFTSATIANPVELAQRLAGLDGVELVDRDEAPAHGRDVVMWNPPALDDELGTRRSALAEAAEILDALVRSGRRTICFCRSRKGVEVLTRLVRDRLGLRLADGVAPYRAGYTGAQRREIEERLVAGELRAVITTDALELGIDVGALDAAVVVTFPGTVASLRQMWGRAGRAARGLAIYVAGEDALDQFFCRHPEDFLTRGVEGAILDHASPQVRRAHLLCAAHEGPLHAGGEPLLGDDWEREADVLVAEGALRRRGESYALRDAADYPAARVSLRSAQARQVAIVDCTSGEVLGFTEHVRGPATLHPGAIYMHLGRSYEVAELDLEYGRALVSPFEGDWYTQPKHDTDTDIVRLHQRRETLGVTLSFGDVRVSDTVLAYQRRRLADHGAIDMRALDLPRTEFDTQAVWFELDARVLEGELPLDDLLGTLHAAEHAQIAVLPLLAMCDRWDVGGLSTNLHPQTGGPTIFIYDGHPGGVGIARLAFDRFERLVTDARRLIAECRCADGCPSCVQSPKCGNLNEPLSKTGARVLLERMEEAPLPLVGLAGR